MVDTILRNALVFGEDSPTDLAIESGKIVKRGPNLDYASGQEIDLAGRLVVPGFVDPHVHLDIALMNSWRVPGRMEPYLSHYGLNEQLENRRQKFTREDIIHRASAALELASRHGVTAMRVQCHVDKTAGLKHLEALVTVKEKYADRLSLQITTFPQQGLVNDARNAELFREAFKIGADVVGCASNLDVDSATGKPVDFRKHINAAFDLAAELDVDLDIHADLGIPDSVTLDELEVVYVAHEAIKRGYQGRVTAGHVCALDSALPDVAKEAIAIMKEAEVNVVSQPDLYRLARDDQHHVRRGLTKVKELLQAGVNVVYASNNVRDALRPVGNFNPLEEALILSYGAHMDTIEELQTLLKMSTYFAAKALGLKDYGLDEGCKADLVVLDAYSPSAAIVGLAEKNYVFKNGRLMASSKVISELYNGCHFAELSKY